MAKGRRIGRVVDADFIKNHQSTETIADVAVVQFEEGIAVSNTRIVRGPGVGKKLDLVVAYFLQAEDGIRDPSVTGGSDVCSSDLRRPPGAFHCPLARPHHGGTGG